MKITINVLIFYFKIHNFLNFPHWSTLSEKFMANYNLQGLEISKNQIFQRVCLWQIMLYKCHFIRTYRWVYICVCVNVCVCVVWYLLKFVRFSLRLFTSKSDKIWKKRRNRKLYKTCFLPVFQGTDKESLTSNAVFPAKCIFATNTGVLAPRWHVKFINLSTSSWFSNMKLKLHKRPNAKGGKKQNKLNRTGHKSRMLHNTPYKLKSKRKMRTDKPKAKCSFY